MSFTLLLIFAMLVEAVVETVKWLAVPDDSGKSRLNWERIAALVIAVVLCVLFSIDIFALAGFITPVPYAASIATGLIIARGATLVTDLATKIKPV